MNVGELVVLNTWYGEYENLGIGKVISVRVWTDTGSPKNCGCEVTALWSDGSVQTFDESELTYAVDNHEDW